MNAIHSKTFCCQFQIWSFSVDDKNDEGQKIGCVGVCISEINKKHSYWPNRSCDLQRHDGK